MRFTAHPSLWSRTMARRRSAGSAIAWNGGKRRAVGAAGGSSARMRLTVCGLSRWPKRTAQMSAISLAWNAACSPFRSRIAWRIFSGRRRCFSTFGGGNRLAMPSASKRAARR